MTEDEATERCHLCKMKCPQESLAKSCAEGRAFATKEVVRLEKELEQYRKIGTVEECQEAVEKQTAMEPIKINDSNFEYQCPKCHFKLEIGYKHCISCGQLLKYSHEIRLE